VIDVLRLTGTEERLEKGVGQHALLASGVLIKGGHSTGPLVATPLRVYDLKRISSVRDEHT
jgi:hypothetical protein